MASLASADARQQGLQQAASVLFALMGIVPLLVFAFTLWQVGVMHHTLAQVSVVVTLALMLVGYWLFRSMLREMSETVRGMTRVAQALARSPEPSTTAAVDLPPAAPPPAVTGLGSIWELGEMARTMDLLWQREARAHVGRPVQITVANAANVAGRLVEATEDGLLLEQAGGETVAIAYRRVQGIEPLLSG
jgi:hypothetical protein